MKVRNVAPGEYGMPNIRGPEPSNDMADRSVTFKRTLTELTAEQQSLRLQALAGEIETQGAKLKKRADIKEFEQYRRLIRDFLDEVVSGGYAYSKENAFGARGRHRFFATVQTIDQKLDEMAREVLSGQADSIELLHKIDDIRGLILDMML